MAMNNDPIEIARHGKITAWRALPESWILAVDRHKLLMGAMQGRNLDILRDILWIRAGRTHVDYGQAALSSGFHDALPVLRKDGYPLRVGEDGFTLGVLMWTRSPAALAKTLRSLMDVGVDHEDGSRLMGTDAMNGNLGGLEGSIYGSIFGQLLLHWRRNNPRYRFSSPRQPPPPRSAEFVQVLLDLGDLDRLNDFARKRLAVQMVEDPEFGKLIALHKRARLMVVAGEREPDSDQRRGL